MRAKLGLWVIAVLLLGATAAHAELSAEQAFKRLQAYNEEVKRATKALAGSFGEDLEAEQKRIEAAAKVHKGITDAVGDDYKVAPEALARLKENLLALDAEIENSRVAHGFSLAAKVVIDKHAGGAAATPAQLTALDDAIAALDRRTGPGWAKVLEHFRARTVKLRKEAEGLGVEQAKANQAKSLDDAFRVANTLRDQLTAHLATGTAPIPDPMLKQYLEASTKVKALEERAGRYYSRRYRDFLVANAWRQNDEQAFPALANLYKADLITQGTVKREKMTVGFAGKGGWCYLMLMDFSVADAGSGMKDFYWRPSAKDGAPLTRFSQPPPGPRWQGSEGVCLNTSARLSAKAVLDLKGGAELRYALVGWPRASVPLYVATTARVAVQDPCDPDAWLHLWTQPLPGALVYRGNEPFLVGSVTEPPDTAVQLINLAGDTLQAQKSELSGKPPPARAFTAAFRAPRCGEPDMATGKLTRELQRCIRGVERSHESAIEKAQARVDKARSDRAISRAEAKLEKARDKMETEKKDKCGPIERDIEALAKVIFSKIQAAHQANVIVAPIDRVDQLQAELEAKSTLK
jgi:hypothetical protein